MPTDPDQLRAAYDAVAERYAETYLRELEHKPLDRALLAWFAEAVRSAGPVADRHGPGPRRPLPARARRRGFRRRSLSPHGGARAGAASRPRDELRGRGLLRARPSRRLARRRDRVLRPRARPRGGPAPAFGELARVLRPGAPALLAFHLADATLHLDEWLGARVSVDWHFWPMATVIAALEAAGLAAEVRVERAPYVPHEHPTARGYVLARRPAVERGMGDAQGTGADDAFPPPRDRQP